MFSRHKRRLEQSPTTTAQPELAIGPLLELVTKDRSVPSGFNLGILGNTWLADDFWTVPQVKMEHAESLFTPEELQAAMTVRFSAYVEGMRTMSEFDRDRATRLVCAAASTAPEAAAVSQDLTADEYLYPHYLVCNSAAPDFSSYTVSRDRHARGGFQVFDLAQPGAEDFMDQLRLRGFVDIAFQDV